MCKCHDTHSVEAVRIWIQISRHSTFEGSVLDVHHIQSLHSSTPRISAAVSGVSLILLSQIIPGASLA